MSYNEGFFLTHVGPTLAADYARAVPPRHVGDDTGWVVWPARVQADIDTGLDEAASIAKHRAEWCAALGVSLPFTPAPREWRGNMCGVRVPGLPAVSGGAADPSLVLSWFIDRYTASDRAKIYGVWKSRNITHITVSWPDSRAAGQSAAQFAGTCQELIANGFYPCPMLCSKNYDPSDVAGILANIAPVLPLLVGLVPLACIGWELSLWLSPTDVQQLVDALAPAFVAGQARVYVHFQEDYFSFPQPGNDNASFWKLQIGKLAGVLHQKGLSQDAGLYQARLVDCLQRACGGFGMPADSGFGHPFDVVALEITATPQFEGQMTEAEGNSWGQTALATQPQTGPTGAVARVMGSGNGQ